MNFHADDFSFSDSKQNTIIFIAIKPAKYFKTKLRRFSRQNNVRDKENKNYHKSMMEKEKRILLEHFFPYLDIS